MATLGNVLADFRPRCYQQWRFSHLAETRVQPVQGLSIKAHLGDQLEINEKRRFDFGYSR
jgi:hypothetical protein